MPGSVGAATGHGAPADLPQRAHAVRGSGAVVPADNPTGVYRRTFTVPARVATAAHAAARRGGQLDGLRVGQRRVRRLRHRQPPRRRPTTSAAPCVAAATRCASSCRGGAPRRGSRTRTSGGCPACTAASSWCRCRAVSLGRHGDRARARRRRHDRHARPRHRGRRPARRDRRAGRPATPSRSSSRPVVAPAHARSPRPALDGAGVAARDPADPDGIAGVEHAVAYTLAGPPGARTACACRASSRGTTRRRAAIASSSSLRDADGDGARRAHPLGRVPPRRARRPRPARQRRRRGDQRRQPPRHPPRPRAGDDAPTTRGATSS